MKSCAALLLVSKTGHEKAAALANEMREWLAGRGVRAGIMSAPGADKSGGVALREAAAGRDAVIILGGDGTFIGVARHLVGINVPFLGVNFGRVGFLAEVSASDWEQVFEDLIAGRLRNVPRMLLGWSLRRGGAVIADGCAVNDVVVGRGALARVINLHIGFDGPGAEKEELGWLRSDGLIISSPLGSSAYALSAGGPLVHPDLNNLLLTAVAPLLGSMPPFVIPGDRCVNLCLDPDASPGSEAWLSVDGQEGHPLQPGDELEVRAIPDGTHMLATSQGGYTHTLRSRGLVQLFPGRAPGSPGGQT